MIAMTTSPDIIEFKLQNTLQCHIKPVNHLAVSPGYSHLISIGIFHDSLNYRLSANKILDDGSKVVVWSVTSGEKLFVTEHPFNGAATAVSWASRDTSRFVVGFASGDLHFFRSEDGKVMKIAYFILI
jgi:WD40 repeat protein